MLGAPSQANAQKKHLQLQVDLAALNPHHVHISGSPPLNNGRWRQDSKFIDSDPLPNLRSRPTVAEIGSDEPSCIHKDSDYGIDEAGDGNNNGHPLLPQPLLSPGIVLDVPTVHSPLAISEPVVGSAASPAVTEIAVCDAGSSLHMPGGHLDDLHSSVSSILDAVQSALDDPSDNSVGAAIHTIDTQCELVTRRLSVLARAASANLQSRGFTVERSFGDSYTLPSDGLDLYADALQRWDVLCKWLRVFSDNIRLGPTSLSIDAVDIFNSTYAEVDRLAKAFLDAAIASSSAQLMASASAKPQARTRRNIPHLIITKPCKPSSQDVETHLSQGDTSRRSRRTSVLDLYTASSHSLASPMSALTTHSNRWSRILDTVAGSCTPVGSDHIAFLQGQFYPPSVLDDAPVTSTVTTGANFSSIAGDKSSHIINGVSYNISPNKKLLPPTRSASLPLNDYSELFKINFQDRLAESNSQYIVNEAAHPAHILDTANGKFDAVESLPLLELEHDTERPRFIRNTTALDHIKIPRPVTTMMPANRLMAHIRLSHLEGDVSTKSLRSQSALVSSDQCLKTGEVFHGDGRTALPSIRVTRQSFGMPIETYDIQGRLIGLTQQGDFQRVYVLQDPRAKKPFNYFIVEKNAIYTIEGNHCVLIQEIVESAFYIVAGTISLLILRLADESHQDSEYIDSLLLTHTLLTTSRNLFDCIVARFNVEPCDRSIEGEMIYFTKWKPSFQLKALSVLARWIELQISDFLQDSELFDALDRFLVFLWESGFKSEADRIRRCASVQATFSESSKKVTAAGNLDLSLSAMACNLNTEPALFFSRSFSSLLDVDSKDLARYLTYTCMLLFHSIGVRHYISKVHYSKNSYSSGCDEEGPENPIDQLALRLDKLRSWVALEICCVNKNKVRRRVIEKFIQVAKICQDLRDFSSSMFITSGLLSAPVQRLKGAWSLISSQHQSTFDELGALLDPTGNMLAYRHALSQAKPPFVPFLPVLMKDLTFAVEGNPDFLDQPSFLPTVTAQSPASMQILEDVFQDSCDSTQTLSKVTTTPNESLINFDKFLLVTEILNDALRGHSTSRYNFSSEFESIIPRLRCLLEESAVRSWKDVPKRRPMSWQAFTRFTVVNRRISLERASVIAEYGLSRVFQVDLSQREAAMKLAWELSFDEGDAVKNKSVS
ncbi:hypothetical protein BASA83_009398 [Batrachochytrium salamandrivorans]|nr:hypothetical protein BASA81_005732 [Batrachochytrium salamandrivorans]KAH9268399.1 hypothetical protein BASA83_009398 [Batrachochytrium salamandrivorans]